MKKSHLLLIIFLIMNTGAYAVTSTPEITCPTNFPNLPLVQVQKGLDKDHFSVQSNSKGDRSISLVVKSASQSTAIDRAKELMASDLKPMWNQAKLFVQVSIKQVFINKTTTVNVYYCAYSSKQYQLSSITDDPEHKNPNVEMVSYLIKVTQ